MKEDKTTMLITVTKELKERIMKQAEKEYRNLSNLVVKVMTEYLDTQS